MSSFGSLLLIANLFGSSGGGSSHPLPSAGTYPSSILSQGTIEFNSNKRLLFFKKLVPSALKGVLKRLLLKGILVPVP